MATYREIHGKAIKSLSSDPSDDAVAGQISYNTATESFKSVLASTAWSSGAPRMNTLKTSINNWPNKEYAVVGYRNIENECCTPYVNDIYNPNCQLAMQTRFTANNIWQGTFNYFSLPIQLMHGTTNDRIFELYSHHSGGGQPGSYLYEKVIDYSREHPHALKIEWGGDCSLWSNEDSTTCTASSTGYLDLATDIKDLNTITGQEYYITFDYLAEVNSPLAYIIVYQDGYKSEVYDIDNNPRRKEICDGVA